MPVSLSSKKELGVVAIAKNEEKDLPGFLTNLINWVDEIVIVDNESTDETEAIARSAGEKVIVVKSEMPETGFAGLRNKGIEQATASWLLHMDIDERVPADLAREMRRSIRSKPYQAYRLKRLNFFLNRPMKGGGLQHWSQIRFAKREAGRFEKPIHEEFQFSGPARDVGELEQKIWHLNDESYRERMRKSDQYCLMVANEQAGCQRLGWLRLLWRPIRTFVRSYLLLGGLRDGIPGLIWAQHSASAELRIEILRWDRCNAIGREAVEKQVADSFSQHE
jgi:glycosyltransferase involved in cell wall biosynthesis